MRSSRKASILPITVPEPKSRALQSPWSARGKYEPILAASTKNLGDRVEIRIRDNGTGIPAEVREEMFNSFFTTKPDGEGTGLGL
jgi:C4-dicarboxylate-specific signal transduction histidine kinase